MPQLCCLVRGQAIELGYVALAERESVRSPQGLAVERDDEWRERTLAAPSPLGEQASGYWRRGEDRRTAAEAENGVVPGDAVWVAWPAGGR